METVTRLRVGKPHGYERAADIWLRRPAKARALLAAQQHRGELDGPALALLAWLTLTHEQDEKAAEHIAYQALEQPGDTRFATATLTEVLLGRGAHDEAIEVIEAARARYPTIPWYHLTLADALLDAGRRRDAAQLLNSVVGEPKLRRHALKRLVGLALERGQRGEARRLLEEQFELGLDDYLLYASDFLLLGELQLEAGDWDAARRTWRSGAEIYPRNEQLRELLHTNFGDAGPKAAPLIAQIDEEKVGIRRIPVRTPMITLRSGILEVVEEATAGVRQIGDVLALSESAAAAGQGRMLPLELVDPGPLARRLCRFVGKMGPLSSPEGMQGAIMEVGRARVVLGAVAGALGRLLGRHGWFFRVAGQPTALIDDVAACMPPHDHHVIFGPGQPNALSESLARALGCGVAIVDANHRSGALVIGASREVDRAWLVRALADNPAGNEDEQTPVVLVRALDDDRSPRPDRTRTAQPTG